MKPEYEMYYDVKYKAYCGRCHRILLTGGITPKILQQAKEKIQNCPHCGKKVDWDEEESNDDQH